MAYDLEITRERMQRAWGYFDQLKKVNSAYHRRGPYEDFPLKFDEASKSLKYFVRVKEHPPLEMSLLVGDFIHNLRASVDNMIWMLGQNRGEKSGSKLAFPVCSNVQRFAELEPLLKRLPRAARVLVEGFQPYHRTDTPSAHPLYVLDRLWNNDKHRVPEVALSAVIGSMVFATGAGEIGVPVINYAPIRSDDPVEIVSIPILKGPDVQAQTKVMIDVTLDERGPGAGKRVEDVLRNCYQFVDKELLPAFEPFFV
jgi:hypothetical protein